MWRNMQDCVNLTRCTSVMAQSVKMNYSCICFRRMAFSEGYPSMKIGRDCFMSLCFLATFNLSSYILVRLLKIIMKIIIKYFLGLLISCCLVFYWVHFEHGIRFVLLFKCDCHATLYLSAQQVFSPMYSVRFFNYWYL